MELIEMDSIELWRKLNRSISYYINMTLGDSDIKENSKEDLLEGYLDITVPYDEGSYLYLDKKTYKYIKVDLEIIEKIKIVFIERLEKRILKNKK